MKKKWLIVSLILAFMTLGMIMAACSSATEALGIEEYRYTVGNVLYILEMTENRGARYTAVTNDLYKLFAVYGGTGAPVLVSEGHITSVTTGGTAKVQNYSLKDEKGTNLIVQVVYATVANAAGATSEVPIVAQVVGILVPSTGSNGQTVQFPPGTTITPNLPTGSTITNKPSTPVLTSPVSLPGTGDTDNPGNTTPANNNPVNNNPGNNTPVNNNPVSNNPVNNTGNGTLTITNIPSEFNGKYIAVDAQKWNPDQEQYLYLLGMQSINMTTGVVTLVPISGGQAVVPMWKATFSNDALQSVARYSGSDTFTYGNANYAYLAAYIFSTPTAPYGSGSEAEGTTPDMKVFPTVTFSNGSATVSYATGFAPEDWGGGEGPGTSSGDGPGTLITLPTGQTVSFTYSDWEEVTDGTTVTRNYLLENVTYAEAKTTLEGLLGASSSGSALQNGALVNVEAASAWVVFEINQTPGTTANTARFGYRLVHKVAGAVQNNVNPTGVGWIANRDYSYGDDSSTSLTFSRGTGARADEADVTKKAGATLAGALTIPDLYYTGAEFLPVTLIGSQAFWNCEDITSVSFPSALKIISESAFNNCNLTSLPFPDSLTTIGGNAFYSNDNLAGLITITKNVTYIGSSVFGNCPLLSRIRVEAGNTSFSSGEDGILFNYDKTTLVKFPEGSFETTYDIPSGVKTIGSFAVYNVNDLTDITLPASVTTIEGGAFQSCEGLTTITIPAGVTSIGAGAFAMSYSLTEIICKPETPPTIPAFSPEGDKVFPSGATIKVPSASVAAYKAAPNWSDHVTDVNTSIVAEE